MGPIIVAIYTFFDNLLIQQFNTNTAKIHKQRGLMRK